MKVAILDLNNNVPNRGIGYIKHLVETHSAGFSFDVFDVRHKNEIPGLDYDIYISSGGPGSPFDYTGGWDKKYFEWIEAIWQHNLKIKTEKPKFVFLICHSFQLACLYFKIGKISLRSHGQSFGTFPCYRTPQGARDKYLKLLDNPFWIADFRDWQVINADRNYVNEKGFKILAHEPIQKNNEPRAIMAIRFSETMFGTQFHPEADADGMSVYFSDPIRQETVTKNFGAKKYNQMITDLNDANKIQKTFKTLLPTFLNEAANANDPILNPYSHSR